jgi:Nif-specific regulatory protein
VLICGESGTGKELVARAIHRTSPRVNMPFIAINCASLNETLLESELFGHEKGAFTGAIAQKKGKLELADRGTIFLDEVSEIPIAVQAKLLRVIQEREFERLGGTRTIKIDVRFIAATNRNLEQAIRAGTFRQDLYYRLNVIRIDVPALRDRESDIPLLAKYFVSKYSKSLQRRVKGLSPEALQCLLQHDWPGNIRELENLIERAIVLGNAEMVLPEDLPEALVENFIKPGTGFLQSVKESKKKLVQNALQQAGGNYAEAAKILGVHPNYLYRLLRSLGLKKD